MSADSAFDSFLAWLRLKLVQLIWLAFAVVEAALGLRVALRLIDANPDNLFANLIYTATRPLMIPFYNLTETPRVNGLALDINALIAMAVGALAAWIALKAVTLIFSRPAHSSHPLQAPVQRKVARAPSRWFNQPMG